MILLDTHMVLALLGQTDLVLPKNYAQALSESEDKVVSVASLWEIAIKNRKGKLRLFFPISQLEGILNGINIDIIPIIPAHTFSDIGPEPTTKDPFDRLLLGVCAHESLSLLTIDRALIGHPLAWRE